jgi:hypothetical protein
MLWTVTEKTSKTTVIIVATVQRLSLSQYPAIGIAVWDGQLRSHNGAT